MNYNMNSNLEDMRNEYLKLKKQREVDNSVKFQRKSYDGGNYRIRIFK